jgi:Glu-tRNA(Gln) amidotransferase subunit E-like FAD-binding protein
VVTCASELALRTRLPRRPVGASPPSLVRTTLLRNGGTAIIRDALVQVPLASESRIVSLNGGRVWCARYRGLAGLFRKDRGPSKELGRALCDEVKRRFACEGFLTTDELPRYGLDRSARRTICATTGAGPADCVLVYAYPLPLAEAIDEHVYARLVAML